MQKHGNIDVCFYIFWIKRAIYQKWSRQFACIWQIVYLSYACKLSTTRVYTTHCYGPLISFPNDLHDSILNKKINLTTTEKMYRWKLYMQPKTILLNNIWCVLQEGWDIQMITYMTRIQCMCMPFRLCVESKLFAFAFNRFYKI